jgi:hypothetical protein
MGGENNNNNRVEGSLQLHGGIATNVLRAGVIGHWSLRGRRFGHTAITAHDYLPVETNNTLGGNLGRQVMAAKTLRNRQISCIDDITTSDLFNGCNSNIGRG